MSMKVLVVDDSPAVRLMLRAAIERVGVSPKDLLDTEDPLEAMMVFQTLHPEVVFMDLSLAPRISRRPRANDPADVDGGESPGRQPSSGEVLARQMLHEDPTTKLVLCTGAGPEEPGFREVVKMGAFGVIEKPVTLEQVQKVFQQLAAEGVVVSGSGSAYRAGEEHPLDLLLRGV